MNDGIFTYIRAFPRIHDNERNHPAFTYAIGRDRSIGDDAQGHSLMGIVDLRLPVRLAAHDTVSGWCHFAITSDMLRGNRIERYEVELTDAHCETITVNPLILSERRS